MFTIIFFIIVVSVNAELHSAYHSTNEIFKKISGIETHQNLNITYYDDIMVVDINSHLPRDVLIVANEHARERITGEVALYFLEKLHKTTRRITVIPVLNVWGRKRVEHGHPCIRKNSHGVDTNRNFQVNQQSHHYLRHGEEYEGPHPLSEKESKLVASILNEGIQTYINVHSGEYSIYIPYDGKTAKPPNYRKRLQKIKRLRKKCPMCKIGQASVTSYKAFGTSVDYATSIGVPEAYTFEVFGSNSARCDHAFNPRNTNQTLLRWVDILYSIL